MKYRFKNKKKTQLRVQVYSYYKQICQIYYLGLLMMNFCLPSVHCFTSQYAIVISLMGLLSLEARPLYIFACIGGRIDSFLYALIRRLVILPSYVAHGYMNTPLDTHYFYYLIFAKLI